MLYFRKIPRSYRRSDLPALTDDDIILSVTGACLHNLVHIRVHEQRKRTAVIRLCAVIHLDFIAYSKFLRCVIVFRTFRLVQILSV